MRTSVNTKEAPENRTFEFMLHPSQGYVIWGERWPDERVGWTVGGQGPFYLYNVEKGYSIPLWWEFA